MWHHLISEFTVNREPREFELFPSPPHLPIAYIFVVGLATMGNIAPRAGIEPTSLAFRVSLLTITPLRLPDVATLFTPNCLCDSSSERPVQFTTYYIRRFVWVWCVTLEIKARSISFEGQRTRGLTVPAVSLHT